MVTDKGQIRVYIARRAKENPNDGGSNPTAVIDRLRKSADLAAERVKNTLKGPRRGPGDGFQTPVIWVFFCATRYIYPNLTLAGNHTGVTPVWLPARVKYGFI